MSIHGVLGETTSYPKTYQPDTLYAIPRALGRQHIGWQADKLANGVDWWHAFEVSWLTPQGVSQVAIARFAIPASSPNIVESKSLKLYLNSLNFTEFDSRDSVQQTIAKDLSDCVGAKVDVDLFDVSHPLDQNSHPLSDSAESGFLVSQPLGQCLDNALQHTTVKIKLVEQPDATLLTGHQLKDSQLKDSQLEDSQLNNSLRTNEQAQFVDADDSETHYQYYSNLLRSNCPVTNQPDWGTLAIDMTTAETVLEANLLHYVLSFRQHNGFHEQCVEQIFADLSQAFNPSKLMVRAWYTRRGGIDINPCRVSDSSLLPVPSRLIRQ